jgi:hypothetical protein
MMTEKEQQAVIARQYQNELNKVQQEDIDKRNKHKQNQMKYNQDLHNQLKEKRKKNTYGVLMTEHERSINDNDIKAYQNMESGGLNAMIPGFNSANPHDKYIDKAMNLKSHTPIQQSSKLSD